MFVTECSVGTTIMTPESARDKSILNQPDADVSNNHIDQLRAIAGLCNSAEFDMSTSGLPLNERKINGDATDKAILRFSESLGPVSELRQLWKKEFELAFNSKNKFMIRTFSLLKPEGLKSAVSLSEECHHISDDVSVEFPLTGLTGLQINNS